VILIEEEVILVTVIEREEEDIVQAALIDTNHFPTPTSIFNFFSKNK